MGKKSRILIVSTTFPRWEDDRGPAPFVFELAYHLQEYFQVTVLAPHYPGAETHEVWKGLEIFRFKYLPEKWEYLSDGQGLQNHLRTRKISYLALIPFCLSEFLTGYQLLRERKFDAVNSHWMVPSGLLIGILCRWFKIKHFITVHSADYFLLKRIPGGKLIIRLLAQWSKALLPVNQNMAEDIKSIWPEAKIFVRPMGFSPEKFQHCDKQEAERMRQEIAPGAKQLLIFVGKLTEKKGIKNLIEAMKLLEKKFPFLQLLIVGDGMLRSSLESTTRALGLEQKIKFLGAISHQQIGLLYHLADVVVVPSTQDQLGESEGMPVVVLEGLASGKPVLGTVYCSVPEELKTAGFVEIKESKAETIAEAVQEIFKGNLPRDISKLNNYSWEAVAKFYAEVIQS